MLRLIPILFMLPIQIFASETANPGADLPLPSFFKADDGTLTNQSPMAELAHECGVTGQKACTPDKTGGRTMCGRGVASMVKCMSQYIGGDASCDGNCGDAKMYVDCQNQQMTKCGYTKIEPTTAKECSMPGAVLAYAKSPTTRGQKYGHVEFICGEGQYCSIYKAPHTKPWPKSPADGCWYPKIARSDASKSGGL